MQCPNCHHDNRSSARFCEQCGTALAPTIPTGQSQVSLAATGSLDIGGDVVGRDKTLIQIVANLLYAGPASGPAPLPLAEALERYLTHLIDSNKTLRLQGIRAGNQPVSVNLEKVYVSLHMRGSLDHAGGEATASPTDEPRSKRDLGSLSIPQALRRHRRLVIVGDPGCGKTTLLSYLALTYARGARDPDDVVKVRLGLDEGRDLPILLPLRFLGAYLREKHTHPAVDGPAFLLDLLHTYYHNQSITLPDGFFAVPLEKGRAVILLDGMDEVADRNLRKRVARLVEKFALRYPGNRFVVTSRKVGYEGPARLGGEFALAEVQDFSTQEVRQFLRDWTRVLEATLAGEVTPELLRQAESQANALISAIERNPRISELAVNPLLLTVIALVHRQRAKLPNRRSELYAEAVDVLLGNWDEAKEGVPPILEVVGRQLDAIDRRAILEPVAFWMHEHHIREIDRRDLFPHLEPSFAKLTGNDHGATKRAVQTFLDQIDERSGLFVARGMGVFSFAHLTFQEYLAARVLADSPDAVALVQQFLDDPWWREALFLAPGSTESKRRASDLIRAMLSAMPGGERHDHLILAAECVTDVGEVRVEGGLLGEIRRRLKSAAEAPEPHNSDRRRSWILSRVSALNALARLESGELTPRFWRPITGEPDWVTIPAGTFWMGSTDSYREAYDDERQQHRVFLEEFSMARVPITNAQYALYVMDTGIQTPDHWRGGRPPQGQDDHPVVGVNWHDAQGYCHWLSDKVGRAIRLPTEAEWEKAARGDRERLLYPWGDEWDELRCNSVELGLDDTSPVGLFLSGASQYGVMDLVGNVWEWCQSQYSDYPYVAEDGREELTGNTPRVLRGGSFLDNRKLVRCTYRLNDLPNLRDSDVGFRVVAVASGPLSK